MAIRELKVRITGDNSGLQSSLKDSQKKISGFSNVLKGAVAGMAAAFSFDVVIRGLVNVTKAASDAQETFSKFEVVFSTVAKSADVAFKDLRENYGLSSKAAKQLLSDTGDLLTGFGFSQQAALDLSTRVNKLAVDLASFTNFSGGAAGASQALTKALLGERESVKALGISILEEDVKKQVAINTAKGLTFETERQARAYATLDLAVKQSGNAIGDYDRTSDSLANKSRLLNERLKDLSVTIGNALVPGALTLTDVFLKLTEKATNFFRDVTTETNFSKLEKFGRLLGGALLGIVTGGRAGRGLTDPVFFAAMEAQAEALLTPLDKVNKAIGGIYAEWRALQDVVDRGDGGLLSTEQARRYRDLNSKINDLFRERTRLQKEQTEAELAASNARAELEKKALEEARKLEQQRRAGLGDLGRLQEDLAKAEDNFIQANSDKRRRELLVYMADLREAIELIKQASDPVTAFQAARPGGGMTAPERITPLQGAVAITPPTPELAAFNSELKETELAQLRAAEAAKKHAEAMETLKFIAEDAAFSIGEALGAAAGKGGEATAKLIAQALAAAMAQIIRWYATTLPPPLSLAAIATSGAILGLMKSQIPAFRDGGVAYGPTMGMIGEYANARTNPEIIAPLDKLQGMLGGGTGEVEFRIKGQELWGVLKKYENRLSQNA